MRGGTLLFVIVAILMVTVVLRDSRPAGVPTTRAPRAIATTNRYRRFEADDVDDVVWPVGDIRELVVVPEGLFIRAEGRSTPCGVGVGPEWVALLPLLVEWVSALHGDDSLASIRARVSRLVQGAQAS